MRGTVKRGRAIWSSSSSARQSLGVHDQVHDTHPLASLGRLPTQAVREERSRAHWLRSAHDEDRSEDVDESAARTAALRVDVESGQGVLSARCVHGRDRMSVFFADHSPWQPATDENTNGVLRHCFPKGTDLRPAGTLADLAAVSAAPNRRPRARNTPLAHTSRRLDEH